MSSLTPSRLAIVLDAADNVATALVPLAAGQRVESESGAVTLAAAVPRGHKFALRAIRAGEPVVKYGQPIGRATVSVAPGQHVHSHNLATQRGTQAPSAQDSSEEVGHRKR
jgi:altronate hydrolase